MRSKLEMYIDILKVLAEKGPLKPNLIVSQANISGNLLKGYLDFLVKQGLITENVVEKNCVAYSNTNRGTAVIKFFGGTDKTLSITKENDKFLPITY